MIDMIALDRATIHSSPVDIASWPITVAITRLDMDPRGGLALSFVPAIPARWKWASSASDPAENYQFTVWAVITLNGQLHAAGFIEMWQGRSMTDGSLPAILGGFRNWWGDARHLWGPMSDYVPQAADPVGFFISAGNARLESGVTSVRERSNVVRINLPASDQGSVSFRLDPDPPPPPPPTPTPMPPPAPAHGYDEGEVVAFASTVAPWLGADYGRVGVVCARMQYDAAAMGYTASRAKHLAELQTELGLG